MNRKIVIPAGEGCDSAAAGDYRKSRDTGERERLEMIAAEEYYRVGFCFIEKLAEFPHCINRAVELLRILIRRTREELRCVAGSKCGDNLTHRIRRLGL